MPWNRTSPMDQKRQFVADYQRECFTMTELCARYGVSRKTGYKWIARHWEHGVEGLKDRSRRPASCPHATDDEAIAALIEARRRHPTWGAKKLLALLKKRDPKRAWPARSTACDILKRHGLVPSKRRRRRQGHAGRPDTPMTAPNEIWTADFKGQFRTGDGVYCYPLTIVDGCSRFILACHGLPSTAHEGARLVFQRAFREYGLPKVIRTDNGVPFATSALARLSRLSVWWVRLGIFPELIEPAHPEQNGRHERMHRTLKAETTRPAARSARAQQLRFTRFVQEFNHERPHEALDQRTPASVYARSERRLARRLSDLAYPAHFERRLVSRNGGVRWNKHWVNVSHVLAGEYVGFEEIDNQLWDVYFGPIKLGRLDERDHRIEDALGRKMRRRV